MLITLAESDASLVADGLILMVVGMTVVFLSLLLLLGMIQVIRKAADSPAVITPSSPSASPPAPDVQGLTPELIAVLTAAATAVVHQPVHIQRVSVLNPNASTWAQSGRRNIMTSHQPHKRN